jgi:hypothetical protein
VQRSLRWALPVIAVALLVAAADGVLYVTLHHDDAQGAVTDASQARPDRVAVIDPRKHRVVGDVEVGYLPTRIVAGSGGVWVLNRGDGTVSHIDPHTRRLVGTLAPGPVVSDIALGDGGVWLTGRPRFSSPATPQDVEIERVNPVTGAITRDFSSATGAFAIAAAGGALWTTGYLGPGYRGTARSDAKTGLFTRLDPEVYGELIAADNRSVYWVSLGSQAARVDTSSARLARRLHLASNQSLAAGFVPPQPTGVTLGAGSLWISTSGGTVLRVDSALDRVISNQRVCSSALGISYGEGAVWVACGDNSVVPLDPSTGKPGSAIDVGHLPRGVAAGEGAVWVTLD